MRFEARLSAARLATAATPGMVTFHSAAGPGALLLEGQLELHLRRSRLCTRNRFSITPRRTTAWKGFAPSGEEGGEDATS